MEERKFRVLLSLMLLALTISSVSLILTLSQDSGKSEEISGPDSDILQTPDHLSAATGQGPAIARIGDKKITRQELEEQFQILPPEMAVPFVTRQDTLNFLRQYLGLELVYQEAVEQGLGKDRDILAQLQDTKRQLMIEEYLATNLARHDLIPSEEQIEQYYQVNKAFMGGKSLKEVRPDIIFALKQQHRHQAYQDLVNRLWQEAKIEIYEDSL
jgi:hypothetical protein